MRELEAVLWQALEDSDGSVLDVLPAPRWESGAAAPADASAPPSARASDDAARIQACLDRHNGVLENAWRELGLSSRYALRRLIVKHGLVVRKRPGKG